MAEKGIVPVKVSLSEGDYYTLWAPSWREHGAEWQAFLGADDKVFVFNSPAELLVFLESKAIHDLKSHPEWGAFQHRDATRVVPNEKQIFDLIGVPAVLADRPGHINVGVVARCFRLAKSLGAVTEATDVQVVFATHSLLGNVERGPEHFAGPTGFSEWTGIGRVIVSNWDKIIDALDEVVTVKEVDDQTKVKEAEDAITEATEAAEKVKAEEEARKKEEAEQVDPYDSTTWATTGIDPIKISIDGRTVYTLRTYVQARPVFLGKYGEIFTFSSAKALVRWLVEHDDHDLAKVSTWEEVMTAANAGDLEVSVHADNVYSFNGITRDIEKGPEQVDSQQVIRAYELLADAADWAADDSVNSFFLANPRMQDYLAYLTGSTQSAGYIPTPPFTEHAKGWRELEQMLIKRFSKF